MRAASFCCLCTPLVNLQEKSLLLVFSSYPWGRSVSSSSGIPSPGNSRGLPLGVLCFCLHRAGPNLHGIWEVRYPSILLDEQHLAPLICVMGWRRSFVGRKGKHERDKSWKPASSCWREERLRAKRNWTRYWNNCKRYFSFAPESKCFH